MESIESSFGYNAWGLGASKVPLGAVLNIGLVMTNKLDVYVSSLEISDGLLSIVITQNGKVIASGNAETEDSVLFLTTEDPCLFGVVEVGSLTGKNKKVSSAIKVNPKNILMVPKVHNKKNTVTIKQDGVTEVVNLTKVYSLSIDPRFDTSYNEDNKELTLSMSEESHRGLMSMYVDAEPSITRLTTVNHVRPDADGLVHVTISNAIGGLSMSVDERVPILTINSTLSPCVSEDPIDKYISPDNVRTFSYMPLDEAYVKPDIIEGNSSGLTQKHRRNTFELLAKYNKISENHDLSAKAPVQ